MVGGNKVGSDTDEKRKNAEGKEVRYEMLLKEGPPYLYGS